MLATLALGARCAGGAQAGSCGAALANIDLNGNDVQPACSAHALSAADCCRQCGEVAACRAFTWIAGVGGGQCCLKTSAAGRRTVPGHISGCLVTGAAVANCTSIGPSPPVPGPPAPPPLPGPPPAPPIIPWGTPPLPSWPSTYNMSLSTAIEPCNYSGLFDLEFASQFGYIDIDWSNGKAVWANQAPMTCEKTLAEAAEKTHKRNPASKIFVYRNLVKVRCVASRRVALRDHWTGLL